MFRKIALLCTYSTVPRTLRMARTLADAGHTVHVIEWDRSGLRPKTEAVNGVIFKRLSLRASYGLHTFYLIPVWIVFALLQIIVGNYRIVQPQNLDCMIPTFLYTRFVKRALVVYDLADFYGDAYLAEMPALGWMSAVLEKMLTRLADAVVLVSERQILQVETKNLPEKVVLFYNISDSGLTNNDYDYSEDLANSDLFTLFYAGVLSYDRVKILMNVIRAVRDLPVKFVFAGFGECENVLHELDRAGRRITFAGKLDHERVMEFTERADLILLPYNPSYTNNRVGLPNKFFEAMACGSVVLAPNNTYMGEIVKREKIGLVVDYNDLTDIKHGVESLVCNEKNIIQFLKENAKRLFAEKYDPERICNRYLMMVESLASK